MSEIRAGGASGGSADMDFVSQFQMLTSRGRKVLSSTDSVHQPVRRPRDQQFRISVNQLEVLQVVKRLSASFFHTSSSTTAWPKARDSSATPGFQLRLAGQKA